MNEFTAFCARPALAPQCPSLRAFWNGNCKDPANVEVRAAARSSLQTARGGGGPVHERCARVRCARRAVQTQFGDTDVTPLGITYSPSSICIRVPGGRIQRAGSRRILFLKATCMATHCRPDGLYLSIKDVRGPGWSLHKCPAGRFVDLGAVAGYKAGVRRACMRLCSRGTRRLRVQPRCCAGRGA